jgi:hypothetical protein
MKTTDFTNNLTSKKLTEHFGKQFGSNITLEKYTREELEDIRNKLRTRVFQQENSAGYNDLLTNEAYQKDQALLQILNTRIKEMLGENIRKLKEKMNQLSEAKKAKPDFLDVDKDGNKKEPMKKTIKDKKKSTEVDEAVEEAAPSAGLSKKKKSAVVKKAKKGGDVGKPGKNFKKVAKAAGGGEKGEKIAAAAMWKNVKRESTEQFRKNVKVVNESLARLINEDEEGKAKAITSAGDIANDFTGWMQRVGNYQTKTMIELADSIKANFGQSEAEQFKQTVSDSLSRALLTLTQCREEISNAVAILAGEATAEEPMGMETPPEPDMEMPPEPGMDASAPDELNPEPTDDFGASDAAAGAGTTGRELRESRFARKLAESHSIISKLSK